MRASAAERGDYWAFVSWEWDSVIVRCRSPFPVLKHGETTCNSVYTPPPPNQCWSARPPLLALRFPSTNIGWGVWGVGVLGHTRRASVSPVSTAGAAADRATTLPHEKESLKYLFIDVQGGCTVIWVVARSAHLRLQSKGENATFQRILSSAAVCCPPGRCPRAYSQRRRSLLVGVRGPRVSCRRRRRPRRHLDP